MVDFPQSFDENFRMDYETFELLFSKVEQYLQPKRNTRVTDSISPRQRLAITLEYAIYLLLNIMQINEDLLNLTDIMLLVPFKDILPVCIAYQKPHVVLLYSKYQPLS